MGFDFSSYLPPPPGQGSGTTPSSQTLGALPTGITQADIPQMNSLMYHPVTNPDDQTIKDSDGNSMGSMQQLDPSGYATQKAQWDEQQKLTSAGLLQQQASGNASAGEAPAAFNQLGSAAPAQLAGHTDYHGSLGMNPGEAGAGLGEAGRLVYAGGLNDSTGNYTNKSQTLIDPNATATDPNWGKLTQAANVKSQLSPFEKTFSSLWPMLPGLFAFGAPMLLGAGMGAAGGAAGAGALAGDQTVSDIAGGALNGVQATAGGALSNLPASLQKLVPNVVRTGIGQLNSSNGKGFDFSKFIPMGLQQIAKGL